MDRKRWKKKIKNACEAAGTYQPFFDSVIDSLAGIMEMRDNAAEKFDASGGNTIVKHTNKGGATNIVKNPALVVVMDCNAQALAYWRELGLTAKSYKSMTGGVEKPENSATLESILGGLGV